MHVVSTTGRSLAGASRFARADHRLPNPLHDPTAFSRELAELGRSIGATVVLPVTDPVHVALLAHPDGWLHGPLLPIANANAYNALSDKRKAREIARAVGIAVPDQWVLDAPESMLPDDVIYPVFAKPSHSVVRSGSQMVKTSVRSARDPAALARVLEATPAGAYPVLIQRRISGTGEGQFLLRWDGEIRAAFAHRRLREKPPGGGQSVYREAVALEPALLEQSRRLLEAVDWQGVAMVEYKREAATETPYLMEVNGRFWGSLQLAIDAGVDFPRLLVEAALDDAVARSTVRGLTESAPAHGGTYTAGIRSRWLWGDIDHLIARCRTDRSDLPPGQPVGLRFLIEFLRPPLGRDRLEVLRLSDPRPFLRETSLWIGSLLR